MKDIVGGLAKSLFENHLASPAGRAAVGEMIFG